MLKLLLIISNNFLMLSDDDFLHKIKNSNLFNSKLKQDLILYFKFLSYSQKENIFNSLSVEQKIIREFLRSLKVKEKIDFFVIKSSIEKVKRDSIKIQELNEKIVEDLELSKLISNI